jgi:hypothetical protein
MAYTGRTPAAAPLTSGDIPDGSVTPNDLSTGAPSWDTNGEVTTGDGLTVGRGAGNVSTNTAVGASALDANTTGDDNTAVGYQAGYNNTTGTRNAFFGHGAGTGNTTGSYNTGIGSQTFTATLTGSENTTVGYGSSYLMTSGQYNTAVGRAALFSNTTASSNTAVGYQAGYSNTTATRVTAVGMQAGYSGTSGSNYSTYLGYQAGYNTTGQGNVFIGDSVGASVTTGSANTFIGANNAVTGSAGQAVTTGSKNTIIGSYTGNQGGLDIRTSSNNIVLSDGDGNPRGYCIGSTASWRFQGAGNNSTVADFNNNGNSAPYGIYVGLTAAAPNNASQYVFRADDSATTVYTIWSNGTTAGRSDERLKKNITAANSQLADVMAMEVVNYEWNESIGGTKEIGWVAQQVQQIKPNLVQEDENGFLHLKREPMVAILWKAVQELTAKVEALEAQLNP